MPRVPVLCEDASHAHTGAPANRQAGQRAHHRARVNVRLCGERFDVLIGDRWCVLRHALCFKSAVQA